MWEVYLGLLIFGSIYGFLKLSTSLQESETDIENYDVLQNVAIGLMKIFFSLLAVATILIGFLLTPHVLDASITSNNQTSMVNQTSIDNINSLNEIISWSTSASFITYLIVALILFIAFFFLHFNEVFQKLFYGKGRNGKEK